MRDPEASAEVVGGCLVRTLAQPLPRHHFLASELARRWCADGRLVTYRVKGPQQVESTLLPFVSHPSEWCDAQLFDAGLLTMQLQGEANEAGFDLKDASAWNVIFEGGRPVFCDLLSFQNMGLRPWWAAGQFGRHFLLPLLLSRRRGLRSHQCFALWRDGVPAPAARELLGWRVFASRYWPLITSPKAPPDRDERAPEREEIVGSPPAEWIAFRRRVNASLSWMLGGVTPTPRRAPSTGAWVDYRDTRDHYPGPSVEIKRTTVANWLERLRPQWVVDVGCNDGEFSELAMRAGAQVIAIDQDHDCVQALYRRAAGSQRLHPLIADIDDTHAGRGWAGLEQASLLQRLAACADVLMLLALVHHLAIGRAVPLPEVAKMAHRMARGHLIVEWIDTNDPQLRNLCRSRRRTPAEFSLDRQRAAFVEAGFVLEHEVRLDPALRVIALLRRIDV